MAFAKYGKKQQSGLKNLGSWFNDVGSTWLMDKPKDLHFSNFAVMRRFIRDEVIRYDNPYAYVSGLMFRASSRVVNVPMEDRARTIGTSNYTLRKSIQLLINSFTSFSIKPLRLATTVGVVCALIGFLYVVVIIIQRLVRPVYAAGYSSIMAGMLFIGSMIMIMLGIIGEYIGRIYICINKSPQYVVRKTYNVEKDTPAEVH
ncbi:MAG: hypothetical protein LUD80_02485 [Clostridiales bacterium]|nr:hypothetical protein [Clostridiales bacterium]